jgi:hypothetical protein
MMLRPGKSTRCATALAALTLLAAGGAAAAARPPKGLWATVNICDTAAHPNLIGVRGNMPGNGTRQLMFMRFHAQYYDPRTKRWFNGRGAVSPWRFVGSALLKWARAGYNFRFEVRRGAVLVLRGVVDFQWRARRRTRSGHRRTVVVRTLHARTRGNHPSDQADPPGYSSGICEIRG